MHRAGLLLLLSIGVAQAAETGLWRSSFNQGITEYLGGAWDASAGGALNLSCKDGRVAVMAQIAGQPPPGGSELTLTTSSRAGSKEERFTMDARGGVDLPAAGLARLWARLRADDIVTLRYADGRTAVVSLAGAQRTLPARPCG